MARRSEVRKIERGDGRPSRWGVSVPQRDGPPRREFFASRAKRDAQFDRLKRVEREDGRAVMSMSASDLALLRDLREILPEGTDPRVAARFFVEQRCPDSTVELRVAVHGFLKKQKLAGVSEDHGRHIELLLRRLEKAVGSRRVVAEVSEDMVSEFLMGMPWKRVTVEGYRKGLAAFFAWCVKRRFCAVSPMIALDRIAVPESEPEFMRVPDVGLLFAKALEIAPEYAPVLALSFFAGMRSSGIARLDRGDIDFEQRGIRHRGSTHKLGRRFFVQGFEDNLWRWLEPWRELRVLPSWPSSSGIQLRRAIYKAAGVVYPHNAGRHSFCTYHVALHGNAERTASLLTHRGSVSTLYDHYRGNTTQAEAGKYFAIVPYGARTA